MATASLTESLPGGTVAPMEDEPPLQRSALNSLILDQAFGQRPSPSRLAAFAGVERKSASRWMKDCEAPADVMRNLQVQARMVDSHDPREDIGALVERFTAEGYHAEVLGAALSDIYFQLTGRAID